MIQCQDTAPTISVNFIHVQLPETRHVADPRGLLRFSEG
jgi:hypothetical protein